MPFILKSSKTRVGILFTIEDSDTNIFNKYKIGPTILEIQVKFKRELRLRQKVKVESFVAAYDGKIGELVQEMRDEKGELLTEMRMKMGLFDMKARRLIAPTPEWLKAVGLEEMQTR